MMWLASMAPERSANTADLLVPPDAHYLLVYAQSRVNNAKESEYQCLTTLDLLKAYW